VFRCRVYEGVFVVGQHLPSASHINGRLGSFLGQLSQLFCGHASRINARVGSFLGQLSQFFCGHASCINAQVASRRKAQVYLQATSVHVHRWLELAEVKRAVLTVLIQGAVLVQVEREWVELIIEGCK
jgi:hypothetical protein